MHAVCNIIVVCGYSCLCLIMMSDLWELSSLRGRSCHCTDPSHDVVDMADMALGVAFIYGCCYFGSSAVSVAPQLLELKRHAVHISLRRRKGHPLYIPLVLNMLFLGLIMKGVLIMSSWTKMTCGDENGQ